MQVTMWVLIALLVVWTLAAAEIADERRVQAELDRHDVERHWAAVEYERAKLEEAGVPCRPDAC